MKHLGLLATTPEGAVLCFRVFCQLGAANLGPHDHPDVTLDCIALARSLPVLDSTRLLASAAFEVASGHRALPTWRGGPVAS